ncbi:type IV pilin N-terminal domain-containing protein [Halomicrococcus gelatinilyticus]|uniref:type IV pilin N-terminal domain-containing protein n=1 Tax=Halomicrococcus gelatinilyticus TaxID=1702103 RepID=UPI002E1197E5
MTPKDYITERIDADRGVSPVIGVILMVAITVILAAVIGAFVMGMGQNVENNVNAGAEIQTTNATNGNVTVTWIDEGNAKQLNVTVKSKDSSGDEASETLDSVGESVTIAEDNGGNAQIGNQAKEQTVQVIVTAVGEDGKTETVVNNEEHTI